MNEDILEKYRKAGRIAGKVREYGLGLIRAGVRLLDVAESVEKKITDLGGSVAFPTNIAIDEHAAHYTPCLNDELTFQRGMLVKLDVGVHIDGYIGDTASSVEIGSNDQRLLIQASRQALMNALDIARPGVELRAIGGIVEDTIRSFGYKPIANLTGHGLGRFRLHDGLPVPNVRGPEKGVLKAGNIVAIEPFATDGGGWVKETSASNIYQFIREKRVKDEEGRKLLGFITERWRQLPFSERWCGEFMERPGFALARLVRSRAISSYPILREKALGKVSQAEHTVLITESGCEILT